MSNQLRKYITSTVGFTFAVVGVTGVIFQFFFKNPVLTSIHAWLGVAMVVAAVVHIYQNWKPLKGYLKQWSVLALLVPVLAVMGYFALEQRPQARRVNPRQIMAKLSQSKAVDLAKVFGKDPQAVLQVMKNDNLVVRNQDETVQELATSNGKPAEAVLGYFLR